VVLARCGITDLAALTEHCQAARKALGLSATRWAGPCLLAAIQLALLRGWPAEQIPPALLELAADRETRSPMRLAEAGPWWDQPPPPPPELEGVDLTAQESELADIAGQRPALQAPHRQGPRLQAMQDAGEPDVIPGEDGLDDRLLFIGHDERGVHLKVIAIVQPDHVLVIHVMPYAYRTRRHRED
jgi:hypothetical protein